MYQIILTTLSSGLKELLNVIPEFVFGAFLPALLLSGALNVFTTRKHIKHIFGGGISKPIAYIIAVFIGIVFSGCACGVLPLFTGLLAAGSTFGIAITFLFAGPTINMMAVVLTGQMFSWNLGIYRILFTIFWALFIGIFMQLIFKKNIDDSSPKNSDNEIEFIITKPLNLWILVFGLLTLLTLESYTNFTIWTRMYIWIGWLILFVPFIISRFKKDEIIAWLKKTKHFTVKISIPLIIGIFILGVIKNLHTTYFIKTFSHIFGNEGWMANFVSSILASLMYFGTCVSVIIVKFFQNSGMANGPMMSIFLSGPAVSFPSMLAMYRIMKFKRTFVYILLVIAGGTVSGYLYGNFINPDIMTNYSKVITLSYIEKNKEISISYIDSMSKKRKITATYNDEKLKEFIKLIKNKVSKNYSLKINKNFPDLKNLIKVLKTEKLEYSY